MCIIPSGQRNLRGGRRPVGRANVKSVCSFPNFIQFNGLLRVKVITQLSWIEGQTWDGGAETGREPTA